MQIFFLFLLFHFIINDERIPIINFSQKNFSNNTEFIYVPESRVISEYEGEAFLFFSFIKSYKIDLYIYEGDSEQFDDYKEIRSTNVFYQYKIKNLSSKKFIFRLISDDYGNLFFVDNSREIDGNLNNFASLFFGTKDTHEQQYLPLLININPSENFLFVLKEEYYGENYINGYLLEYCKLNGSQCIFNGILKTAFFEKGEKYKIRYNCFKSSSSNFMFKSFTSFNIFELEINDIFSFDLYQNEEKYFIVDIKNEENITFYIKSDYLFSIFYFAFISESEKKSLEQNIDKCNFVYEMVAQKNIFSFEKENDYLIIKVKYYTYDVEKGILGIFSKSYSINFDETIEIDEGKKGIILNFPEAYDECFLASSNENMILLKNSFPMLAESTDFIVFPRYMRTEDKITYINSSNKKTKIKLFKSNYTNDFFLNYYRFNFYYYNDYIKNKLDKYGPDSLFTRNISQSSFLIREIIYIYGLKENYYLYTKKYYGNNEFYQYNKELDAFSDINQFITPYYHNFENYNLLNDNLLIISGYKLFTFYNTYDSLIDCYFQKVNDSAHISINENMLENGNLVKLLNKNKNYTLDFTVDHLIKLDNNFLGAEVIFIDNNGIEYILNNSTKVIRDLKGDGITVKSTEKALVYFYKKINDFSQIEEINFDTSQKGKIMKFNITNIKNDSEYVRFNLIKDIGFSGYYPMLYKDSWDVIQGNQNIFTIYIENLYDKIEKEDLYESEGEKFIIYIESFNKEKYKIGQITYVDNLITAKNKFNFEVIPANFTGVLILDVFRIRKKYYQFMMCKSKKIDFKIESSNGIFFEDDHPIEYPFKKTINNDSTIIVYKYSNEILIHSFESDNEFLFSYSLDSFFSDAFYKYSILSIFETKKNILRITFKPITNNKEIYYILLAKKDSLINNVSLSDYCFMAKLFINNDFNSIFIKNIYEGPTTDSPDLIGVDLDIDELNIMNKNEIIINVVAFLGDFSGKIFRLYEPKETIQNIKEINFEEEVKYSFKNKSIFKFEFNNSFGDEHLKIYFSFKYIYYINIYLTQLNGDIKKIDYNFNKDNVFGYLTKYGIYYLELHSSFEEYTEDSFIIILPERLIDIIDLNKEYYENNRSFIVYNYIYGYYNYYLVNDLKKNKKIKFTYNSKDTSDKKSPFIVCNNKTNNCKENVDSYYFEKGNNYTIFINFIKFTQGVRNYYYYPTYKFYSISDDKSSNDPSSSSTPLILGIIFGLIIILIALFYILRFFKKQKQNTDYIKETGNLNNENLLK